ncbi:MAG: hypothetical protein IT443_03835 [Phycisphaeraceae bacterium]|nr:hypothetical protein [Phycisphaeraceae bacterium]
MTSQKVMLIALMLAACGCTYMELRAGGPHLGSPYPTRRVWAVLPMRNESGSQFADGLKMADRLAAEIDSIPNMDAIPVNRVLAALAAMKLREVSNTSQALGLMKALGVDGLVAGTITAYEPYDPPAMGLALELYADADVEKSDFANLSPLTTAATGETVDLKLEAWQLKQPVSRVSAHLAASEPAIRVELKNYAGGRGVEYGLQSDWRRYRINMNLFSDFAAHAMMGRLLHAEALRIAELKLTEKTPSP